MTATLYNIHSKTPELRKIHKVVECLSGGGVILYPTDTGFTLACELSNKIAMNRIRSIRRLSEKKSLTFLAANLSNLSEFARVSNHAYRMIKGLIPGPYTFILPASKMVPKYAQNPKRKTTGIRVPDHNLSHLLLEELGSPIISISAKLPNGEMFGSPDRILDHYKHFVDVAVSSDDYHFAGPSTIIDMTGNEFTILRQGAGMEEAVEYLDLESSAY